MQKIPVNLTFSRWRFKKGHGDLCVAAAKAFGLIEVAGVGDKREVAVTENAHRILLRASDYEKYIKEAALAPKIHHVLWEKYKGDLPQDDVLRQHLIFERHFNENAVAGFISQFRDTISFANLGKGYILEEENGDEGEDDKQPLDSPKGKTKLQKQKMQEYSKSLRELKFLLPSGEAALFLPPRMTDSDFEILEVYLQAHKKASAQVAEGEPENESE